MKKRPIDHDYYTVAKGGPGRKVRAGQTHKVRKGARHPGGVKQGSVRKPY